MTSADADATSDATTADASSGDATSTGPTVVDECIEGTWTGIFFGSRADWAFDSCDGGELWWYAGAGVWCDADIWIAVQGTRCGPGRYGPDGTWAYELTGEVVAGPCLWDECTETPEQCGYFEDMCTVQATCYDENGCDQDHKCMPYGQWGEPPWDDTICVPLARDAAQEGEPCTTDAIWLDDCDRGLKCVATDPGGTMGFCAPLCEAPAACNCQPCQAGEFSVCSETPIEC